MISNDKDLRYEYLIWYEKQTNSHKFYNRLKDFTQMNAIVVHNCYKNVCKQFSLTITIIEWKLSFQSIYI